MRLPRLIKKFFRKATPTQPEKFSFVPERLPELGEGPIRFGPVKLLSTDPPIFLSGIPYDEYVGVARAFGKRYGNVKAGFIIFPTWTIEAPDKARSLRQAFLHHTQQYPEHRFRYICNTIEEASVLESVGQPALFLNHKFTVSEQIFRPLPDVPVEFDAIYNARFIAEKRHELAADIDSVAYLAYSEPQEIRQNEFRKLWAETKVRCPNHALLNVIDDDGLPISQSHQDVNITLARAATGLILSEAEGASYAAMEYMLAGLPVVSTPSIGGRHVYFDPEYTIICEPDPRSVREAVGALKERNISRDYIREKTLQKIEPERQRFQALIDDLAAELGGKRSGVDAWPFAATSGVPWGSFNHHLKEFERTQAELFEKRFDLRQGALSEVQLTTGELMPIVDAILSKPECRLLVFGCGNDSPVWEKINSGGTTVFIEDDRHWAEKARRELTSSEVHVVRYGTRLRKGASLLGHPRKLQMTLPPAVRRSGWDVILVDGPPGHREDLPGRMKSIYEASRLAAHGAKIFVHDCDRPIEAAFADRYLGPDRRFIEVSGRALLRGYAF